MINYTKEPNNKYITFETIRNNYKKKIEDEMHKRDTFSVNALTLFSIVVDYFKNQKDITIKDMVETSPGRVIVYFNDPKYSIYNFRLILDVAKESSLYLTLPNYSCMISINYNLDSIELSLKDSAKEIFRKYKEKLDSIPINKLNP